MHNLKLYPYKLGSESGKDLSRLLEIKRVRPDGTYVPKIGHTIINWGSSKAPNWLERAKMRDVTILNNVEAVKTASNKLSALAAMEEAGVSVPQFTTDKRVAKYWLEDGHTIVERHALNGNSAEGIRVVNLDDSSVENTLNDAPLYTKFIPKSREFRVHVFRGNIIDYQEKKKLAKEKRPENFNKYISSHTMGWVFCRNDIKHIESVKAEAIKAVSVLGLDFGAVDVVFYEETPYVLEVNTAPGIMGKTLSSYVNTFRSFLGLPNLEFTMNPDGTGVVVNTGSNTAVSESEPSTQAVDSTLDLSELVTFQLDRATAYKLKALLAAIE